MLVKRMFLFLVLHNGKANFRFSGSKSVLRALTNVGETVPTSHVSCPLICQMVALGLVNCGGLRVLGGELDKV